jgi:NAD(P)H-hydrate epimerase
MIPILTMAEVRAREQQAVNEGIPIDRLIERAGAAAAERALAVLGLHESAPADSARPPARVTVLAGPGTNGTDGLLTARLLAETGRVTARAYLLFPRDDDYTRAAAAAGVFLADAPSDQRFRLLTQMVASAHLVIDAVFGIGVRLPVQGEARAMLRAVQAALRLPADARSRIIETARPARPVFARPYVLALDLPSGVEGDTGETDPSAIAADETLTTIAVKPGLLAPRAAETIGVLTVAPLGLDGPYPADTPLLMTDDAARALIPARAAASHKGTFGTALIVGGSAAYRGAPVLSAQGAARAGAGLVIAAVPEPTAAAGAALLPEAVWTALSTDEGALTECAWPVLEPLVSRASAVALGMGIGLAAETRALVEQAVEAARARAIPLVLDADALTLLSQPPSRWETVGSPALIVTPHPGEMSRMTGLSTDAVNQDRIASARTAAARWGCTVVLKGAHTVIAGADGRVRVSPFRNSGLARGGTGDVLAGLIAGLAAQGVPAFDAAALGVYLHGLAGELAARDSTPYAMTTQSVLDSIGRAFRALLPAW